MLSLPRRARVAVRRAVALSLALIAAFAAPGFGADWQEAVAPPEGATILLDAPPRAGIYAAPLRRAGAARSQPVTAPVEGLTRWRSFAQPGGDATLALARRYRAALEAQGFETLLDCAARQCGGFAFRAELQVAPSPEMLVSLADFHQFTMRRGDDGAGGALVSVLLSRMGGRLHGQIVTVAQARMLDLDETAALAARPAAPTRAPPGVGVQLDLRGFAILDGVAFAEGSATLDAAAGRALDAAAADLAARPDLAVMVVGHTDASGALEGNLELSRARAAAVREALIARGVAAERLEAEGVAWLAPRARNDGAEGREANRRVELVAR